MSDFLQTRLHRHKVAHITRNKPDSGRVGLFLIPKKKKKIHKLINQLKVFSTEITVLIKVYESKTVYDKLSIRYFLIIPIYVIAMGIIFSALLNSEILFRHEV